MLEVWPDELTACEEALTHRFLMMLKGSLVSECRDVEKRFNAPRDSDGRSGPICEWLG
jgi:hypothetical protein